MTSTSSSDSTRINATKIHHVSFSYDNNLFTAGLDSGFSIFQIEPLKSIQEIDAVKGSVGVVSTMHNTGRFCLVGGWPNAINSPNNVMIWDNSLPDPRFIGQIHSRTQIKNVKCSRDYLVVVCLQTVCVYTITDLRSSLEFKRIRQIETDLNPHGLCEISCNWAPLVLVSLGLMKGRVRAEYFGARNSQRVIVGHDSEIASMALTPDGRILATASSKGTLIRVFNTLDGSLLQEVRRGASGASIHSLAISRNAQWLAASSDKGTVHVFGLRIDPSLLANNNSSQVAPPSNKSSSLSILKGVLPKYFSSEWSVAQFRLPKGVKHVVMFGPGKNTIVIVGMDGSFYRCEYDPVAGGTMTLLENVNILNPAEKDKLT
ncbi:autophagy-related protein 18a-like [Mercurialis annua]|uniref:autophagy-related protein 18a-like n=1 Tax=Mercurialis annua TaxID=3986 RepID=UPI002160E38F|nr:autophagy-related protein 18a-like [Mercurialis annua]